MFSLSSIEALNYRENCLRPSRVIVVKPSDIHSFQLPGLGAVPA